MGLAVTHMHKQRHIYSELAQDYDHRHALDKQGTRLLQPLQCFHEQIHAQFNQGREAMHLSGALTMSPEIFVGLYDNQQIMCR